MKRFLCTSIFMAILSASAYAVPLSGDYVRIKDAPTTYTDATGYSMLRGRSGVPIFRTAAGVDYAVNPSGPGIINVGLLGDTTTISGAITLASARTPSATNRVTIRVSPGVYTLTAQVVLPAYVSLEGVGKVRIIGNNNSTPPGWYTEGLAYTAALIQADGNNRITGIEFENVRTTYPSPCLYLVSGSGETIEVSDCVLLGGAQDPLITGGAGAIRVEDCYIYTTKSTEVTDAISAIIPTGATHEFRRVTVVAEGYNTLWLTAPGTAVFDHCVFWAKQTATKGNLRFGDTSGTGTTARFAFCSFLTGATPAVGEVISSVGPTAAGTTGVNVILSHCAYGTWNYAGALITGATAGNGDLAQSFEGEVFLYGGGTFDGTFDGVPTFSEEVQFNSDVLFGPQNDGNFASWNSTARQFEFGFEDDYLGYLAPSDGELATNLPINMMALRIGNTETISSTREVKAVGLNNTETTWRDYSALTCSGIVSGGVDPGAIAYTAWQADSVTGSTHLIAIVGGTGPATGAECFAALDLQPGSVITRLGVTFKGAGTHDGITVTLKKKAVGEIAWTVVGAAQTYVGDSLEEHVYDVPDETVEARHAYVLVFESATTDEFMGVAFHQYSIQTSKRVY